MMSWFKGLSDFGFGGGAAVALLALSLPVFSIQAQAENMVFPDDAGLVDVTRPPYNARGDGKSDCTAAIQQALQDHPDQNCIIYLPNGIYRVSAPLWWPYGRKAEQGSQRATILQGQSRDGTVIQLADFAPGFGTVGRPRAVLWLGDELATHERNAVRNLTVHTGSGNGGAVGIHLNTTEQGCVRHVRVVAGGSGMGVAGIDAGHVDRVGPCLIKNVRVEGFDLGLRSAFTVNSLTLEDCEFVGQKSAAIRNRGQVISIRNMRSTNEVPAIDNRDSVGLITVLDSVFQGLPSRRQGSAIYNQGLLLVRNLVTPGYTNAIENKIVDQPGVAGPVVKEFSSHAPFNVFSSPPTTLGLEVQETPEVPWDPLSDWSSPLKFGGLPGDGLDDSRALQQAIDSGATTVYLPRGSWHLGTPVVLRGKVRRLIGCEAELNVVGDSGAAGIRVADGDSKVVVIERLFVRSPHATLLEVATDRTVAIKSCQGVRAILNGKGDIFLEDVSSARSWTLRGGRLWARQWNLTGDGEKVRNDGGQFWALGLRGEKTGTLINTLARGKSELLGGLCVSTGGYKQDPMFAITDASATLFAGEASFGGNPYSTIVAETRGAQVRRLSLRGLGPEARLPDRVGGKSLPLYAGYDGPGAVPPRGDADPKGTPATSGKGPAETP